MIIILQESICRYVHGRTESVNLCAISLCKSCIIHHLVENSDQFTHCKNLLQLIFFFVCMINLTYIPKVAKASPYSQYVVLLLSKSCFVKSKYELTLSLLVLTCLENLW